MGVEALVSVVIPTYNNAELVGEAVASVLGQTYARREVVVVDDGSTDDTEGRLGRFGRAIQYVRQEHAGPAVARNRGIRASKGELVAFLDSDDVWLPEKLERCVPVFGEDPGVGVVYTGLRVLETATGRRYVLPQYTMSGWMARELFLECRGVNTSTLVVRRGALERVSCFDEEFFRAQDWDLMVRLAEVCRYAHVPEVLTERRFHKGSLSVTHRGLYAKYNLMVIEKAAARRPDLYGGLKDEALSRAYFRFGLEHYRAFEMGAARKEFRRSLARRWNWRALNYWLRGCLPAGVVRALRGIRLASDRARRAREGSDG